MLAALVVQFRGMWPLSMWRRPIDVLTRRQRKELLRGVRGQAPVAPERLPLARHLAELLLLQRFAVMPQVALGVNFLGLWIADPTDWTLGVICLFAVMLVVYGLYFGREGVRMRRFLDEHPSGSVA
jgi:hypothetical protein